MPRVVPIAPPPIEQIGHVLRRHDRDPSLRIRYAAYDVNKLSSPMEAFGVVASTIILPPGKAAAAQRATKFGWKDETDLFLAHLRGEPKPLGRRREPPTPSPVENPTTTSKPVAPSAVRKTPENIEPAPSLAAIAARVKAKQKTA